MDKPGYLYHGLEYQSVKEIDTRLHQAIQQTNSRFSLESATLKGYVIQMGAFMNQNDPKSFRILYIEDEEVLRDVISDYLEAAGGYEVVCAKNGQEGVEMADSCEPDFILMDVRMPIMDGIEATRVLRNKPETSKLPIYIITAYSDHNTLTECEEAGADGHFTKPPNYRHIIKIIREVINQRKMNLAP